MKIFNTNVYGLEESLIRSGYPMQTKIEEINFKHISGLKNNGLMEEMIGISPELKRGQKLGNSPASSGHDCFLKGIIVQCDIEAPSYWWPQAQRYHWFDFVSSQSKMHKIGEMDFEKFYKQGINSNITVACKILQQEYKDGKISIDDLLKNLPMGLEITAGISTNYLQLKTMYAQRKDHRLKMWREIFCPWVESLPYTRELGVLGKCV